MKAAINRKYGKPEVVKIEEIEKPVPQKNELLIKVFASTVNRTDCGFRSAEYFVTRFWSGLLKPKFLTLGCEFAGIVEETGKDVKLFKSGDKVFGYNDIKFGSHAEYLIINENDAIAEIPSNLSFEEAAPICEGSHYALNIIKSANVKVGQNVLVNGTTGAIGSSAVQLLKYFKATVTAVCETKNMELVKSLGADFIIDYTKEDFTKINNKFDFIFDAVGKSSFGKCKPLLKENGIYISTELGKNGENIFYALFTPLFGKKKVLFPIPTMNKEIINFINNLVETGMFKPVIDKIYNLEDIVEAYKYVETGMKIGNVVIKINNI
jgi:NADPH:quinone reductase-like Zn-dependent oxidoreductase